MNNTPKLPKVTVDDLIKAQQARDVGIAVVVGKEDLKDYKPESYSRTLFNKMARFDKPMNMFDVMVNLTKSERRIMSEMSHSIKWPDHLAKVSFENLTANQKREKYRALRSLRKRDLVRKVNTGRYMFNPSFVIPSREIEERLAFREWEHNKPAVP